MLLSSLSIPLASCWLLLAAFATGQYIVPPIGEYVVPPGTGSGDWADAYSKARALVAQMSLTEKLNITQQNNAYPRVGEVARLGYTGLFYADGAEGVRGAPFASAFPQAINAAASFDRDLMYRRACAIGQEARGKGINTQFGPGLNLIRAPEAGREFEYNGADPYLAGQSAMQHVAGVQSQGVMATMRHYINNDQESGRQFVSIQVDDRTAHELYLWPFQDAVHAGVVSTMCSYNALNFTHSCANPTSLGKWLREELDYQGFIMSDFGSVYKGEEIAAANAGVDTVIGPALGPFNGSFGSTYPFGPSSVLSAAVANGSVPMSRFDDMVTRVVAAWYKVGQDSGYPLLETTKNVLSQDHNSLIRELGAKTTVLLKNVNGALPLSKEPSKYLTVFGQSATVNINGFPAGQVLGSGPADQGTFPGGQGSSYANLPYLITPYEALQDRARSYGSQVNSYFDNFDHTVQASTAKTADAVNATCLVDVRHTCSEGYDRANLSASFEGDQTIVAVAGACRRTIVAYSACGPFNATLWADHPNVTAVVNAGGAGQEAGNALVDVLYGDVNPYARLPYTVGRSGGDYAARVDIAKDTVPLSDSLIAVNYTEGLLIDYRWFDKKNITPIYEFGFGLSYTEFKYSGLSVQPSTATLSAWAGPHDSSLYDCLALVTIDVCNTGDVDGTEIPQLYLGSPAPDSPVKVLRGFDKVCLGKGATQTVEFNLTRRDLSYWDVTTAGWTLPSGSFDVYLGASSRDIRAMGTMSFDLQG